MADGGYDGAGIGVDTPYKQPAGDHLLDVDNQTYNALLGGLGCIGERGFAVLTSRWRTLHHTTASPGKIGDITKSHSSSPTSKRPTEVKVGEITDNPSQTPPKYHGMRESIPEQVGMMVPNER